MLRIPWNKNTDEFTISFTKCLERGDDGALTKGKTLSIINGAFDPLRLVSSVIVAAKVLYSQACQRKMV